MKAYPLRFDVITIAPEPGRTFAPLNTADVIDEVLQFIPPSGHGTGTIIKTTGLWLSFRHARKEKGSEMPWTWWLNDEEIAIVRQQLNLMTWNSVGTGDYRQAVVKFLRSVLEAKSEEVPGT